MSSVKESIQVKKRKSESKKSSTKPKKRKVSTKKSSKKSSEKKSKKSKKKSTKKSTTSKKTDRKKKSTKKSTKGKKTGSKKSKKETSKKSKKATSEKKKKEQEIIDLSTSPIDPNWPVKCDNWKKKANELMEKHGLISDGWQFNYDRASSRAGICRYSKKIISLSIEYVKRVPDSDILNTLLHEIAHKLAFDEEKKHPDKYAPKKNQKGKVKRESHGPLWKKIAIKIGCNGKRCHSYKFMPHSYVQHCAKQPPCWSRELHRKPKIRETDKCAKCLGPIIVKSM